MKKLHVGMIQAWIDVAKYYYATIAQTVVLTGVLKFNQLTWGEIGLILGGILLLVCVVGILHMKFIYPKHSSYLYNKNPVIQEFRDEFAKIRENMAKHVINTLNVQSTMDIKEEWTKGGELKLIKKDETT